MNATTNPNIPRVLSLVQTCDACPSQWEGQLEDGRYIYVRYRHGCLTVGSGRSIDEAVDNYIDFFDTLVGDGLSGFMTLEELRGHLDGVLDFTAAVVA